MLIFNNNHIAVQKIISQDSKMKILIDYLGDYTHELDKDYFSSIIRSIVGQQISNKARDTIWNKIRNIGIPITAASMQNVKFETLRSCGLSGRKIEYIKTFSQTVATKNIILENFLYLENKDIINILSSCRGIGEWTAEMFLIFSLGRLDVF